MNSMPFKNRRRVRIVDHVLQKYLLYALVIVETTGVAIAIWMLYKALGEIIDENTYRIHLSENVKMLSLLLSEGLRVLGAMLLLNVVALIVADRIWAFYVADILHNLGDLMNASRQMDFAEQNPTAFHHAVLEQASNWRQSEALCLAKLRVSIRSLPAELPMTRPAQDLAAATLKAMRDG